MEINQVEFILGFMFGVSLGLIFSIDSIINYLVKKRLKELDK